MRKLTLFGLLVTFASGGFLAGSLRYRAGEASAPSQTARKVLYYVDPMNPAHTSDRPGLAPCGMKMEPVYADATPSPVSTGQPPMVEGAVKISLARQQLAGVHVADVGKKTLTQKLRVAGRVVVDETRTYRIHAAVNGRISRTLPCSTGSLVQKDELLAELNSADVLPAVQSFLFALNTRAQPVDSDQPGAVAPGSLIEIDVSFQQSLEALRQLGMGQTQLDQVIRTRKLTRTIAVTSPAKGILMARNVSDELHVEKGDELFQVADLSRIWILADLAGWESEYMVPGREVRVNAPRPSRSFTATVSKALPLFNKDSRTLQVRLEMENPDHVLRPDMFVDVELLVEMPEMLFIEADAVLDTGQRQIVFVDRGGDLFEPREIRTGRRLGDQVEVVQGLTPGERIVTSGNFLLDSESRMKMSAAVALAARDTKDPVCRMTVEEQEARAAGQFSVHQGRTYYFCNPGCKRSFDAGPAKFLKAPPHSGMQTADLIKAPGAHQDLPLK